MKKFNNREALVIINALVDQVKSNVEYINDMEAKGMNPLFSTAYVTGETKGIVDQVLKMSMKGSEAFVESVLSDLNKLHEEAVEKNLS